MICFNCVKYFKTAEIATFTLNDENGNILEKIILCQECAMKLALALIKRKDL